MLTVGDQFPQFKLVANVSREKGKEFKTVTNKDFDGKWLVFYAYPKDFTFVCPTEIVEFAKHTQDFADRDAVVAKVRQVNGVRSVDASGLRIR